MLTISENLLSQTFGASDPIDESNIPFKNTENTVYSGGYLGVWYPNNTFPMLIDSSVMTASAIIGDTLYAQKPEFTGNSIYASSNIIKYKINTYGGGSWTNGRSMPKPRIGGSMTACNGKLYYIGGDSINVELLGTNTVYEYNPANGIWTSKAPMPLKLNTHNAVCWGDSVIFVIGGPFAGSETNLNVFYYRPSTNTWGTITNSLPSGQGRRTFAMGIDQNKIIIAGGYNSNYLKSTYVGTIGDNASQITWTSAPNLPTLHGYGLSRAGGTASNGYFFVVGGSYSGGTEQWVNSDSTFIYEFASNSWVNVVDNKPNRGYNISNAVVSRVEDGDTIHIYVVGNYTGMNGGSKVFDALKFKDNILAINKDKENQVFSIYPNPTKGLLNIHLFQPSTSETFLEIYNIQGNLLYKNNHILENQQIDLSSLAKGLYFIKIQNKAFIKTEKIILN